MAKRTLDLYFDLGSFRVENFIRDELVEMCRSRSLTCTKHEVKAKLGNRLREWHRQTFNADGTLKVAANESGMGWPDLVDPGEPPAIALPASAWTLKGVQNGRTKDLVKMTARDLPIHSVVFYQHAGSEYFHLYSVVQAATQGPRVRLISAIPGVAAPCPETSIPAEGEVFGLSVASREYIVKFNTAKSLMTIDWPSEFVALFPSSGGASWTDVSPVHTTSSRPGGFAGASAQQRVLFMEDGRTSASRAKTPRGQNLTEAQASVLSADHEAVLNTGNINVYMILYYLGSSSGSACAEGETQSLGQFWGLERWKTQLQPAHLLSLVNCVASVDIRLWASLWDTYTPHSVDQLVSPFLASDDKLISNPAPDLSIIGGYRQRLRICLLNFCATIDALFRLRSDIREALRATVERTMSFVDSVDPGPAHASTPILLHYVAYRFQQAISSAYGRVRGCVSTSSAAVIADLGGFPNRERHSLFSIDVDLILMHQCMPPAMSSFSSPAAPRRENLYSTPTPAPAPGAAPAPAPSPTLMGGQALLTSNTPKYLICGFWNSTRGCRKTAGCGAPHREPTTAAEIQWLDAFFANPRNKKLVRKP